MDAKKHDWPVDSPVQRGSSRSVLECAERGKLAGFPVSRADVCAFAS